MLAQAEPQARIPAIRCFESLIVDCHHGATHLKRMQHSKSLGLSESRAPVDNDALLTFHLAEALQPQCSAALAPRHYHTPQT